MQNKIFRKPQVAETPNTKIRSAHTSQGSGIKSDSWQIIFSKINFRIITVSKIYDFHKKKKHNVLCLYDKTLERQMFRLYA